MAAVVNFIDTTLQAAATRTVNALNADILLTPSANGFHVNNAGANDPASITFSYTLIALDGPATFSSTGCTITTSGNVATLTYANMPGTSATVTASVTVNGQTYSRSYTVTKVLDGATGATGPTGSTGSTGSTGASGTQVAPVTLYQWSTSTPAAPLGTSTLTWATGANSAYSAADNWFVAAPTNPGTPGIKLFVATVSVSAAATVTTSTVSYSSAAVSAWSQNGATGATGSTGASGIQSGAAIVYQWAATIPAGPAGSATYTYSTGAFGAAPAGYSLTPGTSPSPGFTLWRALVGVTDSAANATTAFNWTSAGITAVGYAGQAGSSYVTAYCASSVGTGTSAPAATTGKTSLPAVNSGGITGTYSATVPTLSAGQYQMQSDGIYDPSTNLITWSIPYQSSLKVGSLSAITANLGQITAGSIDIGTGTTSWHVDTSGNTWAGNASYASAPYRVSNAGAAVFTNVTIMTGASTIIDASGLKAGYEALGTKNSDIVVGGANLYPDGGFERGTHPCTAVHAVGTVQAGSTGGGGIAPYAGSKFLFFDTPAGTSLDMYLYLGGSLCPVKAGKQYTYSFMYATATNASITAGSTYLRLSDGSFVGIPLPVLNTGGPWTLCEFQWTCPAGITTVEARFGIVCNNYSWMAVDCIQMEEGNKRTQWKPAQVDIDADTALAQAAADAANTAINDTTTGLAGRLRNNAANVLSGGAGIAVGSLTWNSSGVRTGGYGVGITSFGLLMYNSSGVPTFVANASTGALAVLADISGSTGTFGAVIVGDSLKCGAATGFNNGTNGIWEGLVGGVPKMSIVYGTTSLLYDPTAAHPLTLTDPYTVKSTTFAVSHTANATFSKAHTTTYQDLGLYTASSTGGTGTITYAFALDPGFSPGAGMSSYITISGNQVQVWGKCNLVTNCDIYINITATDASGAAATPWSFNINVDWT